MKRYEVYRHIRKEATIWGLSISSFALLMVSVVVSLLIIIFSFSLLVIIMAFLWNSGLYIVLLKIKHSKVPLFIGKLPSSISNKKDSILNHVNY